MTYRTPLFTLLLISLVIGIEKPVYAEQTNTPDSTAIKRPSIGLVLSGGGARGIAHVGILKILEQNHIPIDYITGTSMGSVIGALYASGMTPDEISEALTKIDWEDVFDDDGPRSDKTTRGKADDILYMIEQQVGVKDGALKLPTALIQGQRFELLIRKLTLPTSKIRDFDKLPIPFRAIAADITTGEEVILGSGDLGIAIRASMAIPGIFAAVEIDGRLLVDGGIANNLPISVVRDMGADIIIAVDISTPLLKRDELIDVLTIFDQLSGLLTRRNVEQQITSLTERDILIIPELGDLTSDDFNRYNDAIAIGITAATKQLDQLKPLSLSEKEYAQHMSAHNTDYFQRPTINFIRISSDSIVNDEMMRARLEIAPGDLLDTDIIDKGINSIYALGNYSHVGYSIIEEDGKTGLLITAREKEWGTSGSQFGLDLSTNLNGDSSFNLAAAFTMKPMNGLNGEWRSIVQIGETTGLSTEWYQPLDNKETYFVSALLAELESPIKFYVGKDVISEYLIKGTLGQLWVGRNFGNQATRLRFGYRRGSGSTELITGDPRLNAGDFKIGALDTELRYDSLNSVTFPTSGNSLEMIYVAAREGLGADDSSDEIEIEALGAYPTGKGSLLFGADFNITLDDKGSIQNSSSIGGFLHLSGLQKNQLSGLHTGRLLAAYLLKLNKSRFFSTYVGASLELGNAWQDTSEIKFNNALAAGSVFLGADTPIGPVYVALGAIEGGENSIYMFIGTPWF